MEKNLTICKKIDKQSSPKVISLLSKKVDTLTFW